MSAEQSVEVGEAPSVDTDLLDVAAHWMEIRSGRENALHR
jgi:hypothetical protein